MSRAKGYTRVSTVAQDLQLQLDALPAAGCEPVFTDQAPGAKSKRPGLDECVKVLKAGATLVVWRLNRLGRSMPHLVDLVEELLHRGAGFRSLQDRHIDTTTAAGDLMFHVFSSLAQFGRRLIQDRTSVGLTAARARGRVAAGPLPAPTRPFCQQRGEMSNFRRVKASRFRDDERLRRGWLPRRSLAVLLCDGSTYDTGLALALEPVAFSLDIDRRRVVYQPVGRDRRIPRQTAGASRPLTCRYRVDAVPGFSGRTGIGVYRPDHVRCYLCYRVEVISELGGEWTCDGRLWANSPRSRGRNGVATLLDPQWT